MRNKDLKEYLDTFPDDADVAILVENPKARNIYMVAEILLVKDYEEDAPDYPVICIEVDGEEAMDDELVDACEEAEQLAGQMSFDDIAGVMPE